MSTQRQDRAQELEALLETFATEGWQLFATEIQQMYMARLQGAVADCTTGDKWLERRGELLMLQSISQYPVAAVAEYDNFDDLEFEDESPDMRNPLEE